MTFEEFCSRLQGVEGKGKQRTALCPAHGDKHQSLSVSEGEDGRILLHCHYGCSTQDVVSAMGLTMQDLFPEPAKRPEKKPKREFVAEYHYTDIDGNFLFKKARWWLPLERRKDFSWSHKEGGRWVSKRGGPQVLYNLPATKLDSLYIVEGEKDVETLKAHNLPAVSGADGAGKGKWLPQYTEALKGKEVAIIQDNDKNGKAFALETAQALTGKAKSVKLLDLSRVWPDIPEKGDVSDMLEAMGPVEGMRALLKLTRETPEFSPEQYANIPADKKSIIAAADIPYEPPRWQIPPYIQQGKGTLIQADSGVGKTALVCAIVAHITTGRPILDIPVRRPGNVLMLSVEDDLPVLRGRIEANGGDLSKCFFMPDAAGFSFLSPEIEKAVQEIQAVTVVFDPLQAFLGERVDMFKANQTRPVLAKLFEMCDHADCSCIIIAHTGKSSFDKSPVNRSLGSVDIPAAMRSVLQVIHNPDNEDERIAIHVKCSNAPKGKSLVYTIGDRGGIRWEGYSDITGEDLSLITKRKEKGVPYEREPLVRVFNQLMADRPGGGFWSYEDVKSTGLKLLGFPPFEDSRELKQKVNAVAKELLQNDGLIVKVGEKSKGMRGIRIEQYEHPTGYQITIHDGEGR